MNETLRLLNERSIAFRKAITDATDLDVRVPTCPEWTLFELARHLGDGQRSWAATVTAGPGATAKSTPTDAPAAPREPAALVAWSAAATRELLAALATAGPDRGCWTWWDGSQTSQTSGAVARRQLQEVAVHTYDAQFALGAPLPLPDEVALDGVAEFLSTSCAYASPWPHEPAALDFRAAEGPSWRLRLAADGVRVARLSDDDATPATASVRGTASDLVLMLYDRVPIESLELHGDRRQFDLLRAWDPDVQDRSVSTLDVGTHQ
jgi:uncharacterized protein (TIGR03083 family)